MTFSDEVRQASLAFNKLTTVTEADAIAFNKILFPDGKPKKMTEIEWKARHRTYTVELSEPEAEPVDDKNPDMWFYSRAAEARGLKGTEAGFDEIERYAKRGDPVAQKIHAESLRSIEHDRETLAANPRPEWPNEKKAGEAA